MRKLILYVTDEQFWTILPTLQGAVIDFAVSKSGGETDGIREEPSKHKLSYGPTGQPQIEVRLPNLKPEPEPPLRVGDIPPGRKPGVRRYAYDIIYDYMIEPPKPTIVFSRETLKHQLDLAGYSPTSGAIDMATKKLAEQGKIVKLNGARYRLAGAVHGKTKDLKDLEVLTNGR